MLAHKIFLTARISSSNVDRTLPFDVPHYLRNRVLWWDRDHHVHVLRHQMPFLYQALLLPGQTVEYIGQFPSNLTENRLPPVLWNENDMVLTLPSGVI